VQIKRIGAVISVQHELQVITSLQQALDQLTPDAALLIFGQNRNGADVGVGGSIGNGARKSY